MANDNIADSGTYTPASLKARSRLADLMLKQGLDISPIGHWTQGLARMAQAMIGGSQIGEIERREEAAQRSGNEALAALLGGGAPPAGAPAAPQTAPAPATMTASAPSGMTRVASLGGAPVTVNNQNAGQFEGLLRDLEASGVRIDPTQTGGYANRNIRGTNTPSMHASGRAVDVNWNANPEGSVAPTPQGGAPFDPNALVDAAGDRPGQTQIPAELARAIARKNGMRWGGDFRGRSPDPMHFEVAPNADTPMQQRTLVAAAGATPPPTRTAAEGVDPQRLAQIQSLSNSPNPAHRAVGQALLAKYLTPQQATEETRNYQDYAKDQQARGLPVLSREDWDLQRRRAGAINIVNQGEAEQSKLLGKNRAETEIGIRQSASNAQTRLGTIATMRRAMADPNFSSGSLTGTIGLAAKQLLETLGLRAEGSAASMEVFRSNANRAVLDGLGGSLGTGVSNADRDFIMNTMPTLSNTPAGNKTMLDIMERLARREIEIANFTDDYIARNGKVDEKFSGALRQWREANPLFSPEEMQGFSQPQQAPTANENILPGGLPALPGNEQVWTTLPNGVRVRRLP